MAQDHQRVDTSLQSSACHAACLAAWSFDSKASMSIVRAMAVSWATELFASSFSSGRSLCRAMPCSASTAILHCCATPAGPFSKALKAMASGRRSAKCSKALRHSSQEEIRELQSIKSGSSCDLFIVESTLLASSQGLCQGLCRSRDVKQARSGTRPSHDLALREKEDKRSKACEAHEPQELYRVLPSVRAIRKGIESRSVSDHLGFQARLAQRIQNGEDHLPLPRPTKLTRIHHRHN